MKGKEKKKEKLSSEDIVIELDITGRSFLDFMCELQCHFSPRTKRNCLKLEPEKCLPLAKEWKRTFN